MREENTVHIPEEWLVPTAPPDQSTADASGKYKLCFEIASGGMATVYLALYQGPMGFEKVVALKTIHRHLAKEQQFLDMFFDEARIAAHIDHPFVCRVIDFGHAQQSYYIAMEYLHGEPLSRVWEGLRADPVRAQSPDLPYYFARIVADLSEGLHAAHELRADGRPMNVVHRDVTPANLFVLYDGTMRVVDFGIATARDKLHTTELGTVKGKYAYVSPEQLDQKKLDRRSDVWAMGVVLWEMLTGKRLFKRDTHMETMRAVSDAPVPPPSSIVKTIPPELDRIVLMALERSRSERYPDARAFALDLESFLGRAGRTVPRAEIGEWLDRLFPGAQAKKRQLVELTRRGDAAMPTDGSGDTLPTEVFRPDEPTTVKEPSGVEMLPDGHGSHDADDVDDADEEGRATNPALVPVAPVAPAVPAKTSSPSKAKAVEDGTLQIRPSDRAPPPREGRAKEPTRSPLLLVLAVMAIAGGAALAYYEPWKGLSTGATDVANDRATDPTIETTNAALEGEGESGETTPPGETEEHGVAQNPSDPSTEIAPHDVEGQRTATEVVEEGPPGEVHITTRGGGWAQVSRNGEVLGRTPLDVTLPPGRLHLTLLAYGEGEPRPLDVEVRSERHTYMTVSVSARPE